MKELWQQVKAGTAPLMTEKQVLDKTAHSNNRQNFKGVGRLMPGSGKASSRYSHYPLQQNNASEAISAVLRQKEQENELLRRQNEILLLQQQQIQSRQANFESMFGQFVSHYNNNSSSGNPFPVDFSGLPPNPPFPPFPSPNSFENCYRPVFHNSTTCPGTSSNPDQNLNYSDPTPDLNQYIRQTNPHMSHIPENFNDSGSEEEGEEEEGEESEEEE